MFKSLAIAIAVTPLNIALRVYARKNNISLK